MSLYLPSMQITRGVLAADLWRLRAAARDASPVSGLTHAFYRYPARFSPVFAGTAIELFSKRGDLVLDPYMGGGTTIVEAMVRGREAVGNDINSLSVFLTRVKSTPLQAEERAALAIWADVVVPSLRYSNTTEDLQSFFCDRRTFNLSLPKARAIKKVMALALRSMDCLPTVKARDFARCALLNAGQLFLNGQRRTGSLVEFRARLRATVHSMLVSADELAGRGERLPTPVLINASAEDLGSHEPFSGGHRARLVVTSPPYPGIHMLYHRWQVDGRRESPAPYWLADCQDGQGNAFYNFAGRERAEDQYFKQSLATLQGVRAAMEKNGIVVQLIAFSDPPKQLSRYLQNMEMASFREIRLQGTHRIWRNVPSRRWHAQMKGRLNGSREVVLVHEAV